MGSIQMSSKRQPCVDHARPRRRRCRLANSVTRPAWDAPTWESETGWVRRAGTRVRRDGKPREHPKRALRRRLGPAHAYERSGTSTVSRGTFLACVF
jgi:hypothetical protein